MYGKSRRIKSTRPKFADKISKQETTSLKIELASEAIRKENLRRKKHNNSLWRKNRGADRLPMLRPSYIPVHHHNRHHALKSNKTLCGLLSILCDTMRWNGIPYPWATQKGIQ